MRCADAGTNEGREAPPGAEIGIGVDESDPARIAALIDVRESAASGERGEIGAAEANTLSLIHI